MGKKSETLTQKQSIRKASNTLERHILSNNHHQITKLLENALSNISHATYSHIKDIIRETKKETALRPHIPSHQHQELRDTLKRQERLQDQFQEQLHKSTSSYQRTYDIFKKTSLKQKYQHLLKFPLLETENNRIHQKELTNQEAKALAKIRNLYKRYRVSNMFKTSVIQRVNRKLVESLIRKGWMSQHCNIISLTS